MSESSRVLRTGVLFKKGSGAGPFGRKNWKPRYFVLTPLRLEYFTFQDGERKGELSLEGCDEGVLEVMPADSLKTGSSASTIWRVAINAPERRLLVAAGTEMEMNDWVDKLVLAFRMNAGQIVLHRASLPTSGSTSSHDQSHSSIRDFQNFAVPRRGGTQRHSTGADLRFTTALQGDGASRKQEQSEAQEAEEEWQRVQQVEDEQVAQEAAMRRELAAQQEREMDEMTASRQQEAVRAAAEKVHDQQEQEKLEKQEQRLHNYEEVDRSTLQPPRDEEEAHIRQELKQEELAHALAMQEIPLEGEDLLEQQRHQKRQEHAHQRAERQKAIALKLQQEKEEEDLAFRLTQQKNAQFSVDDESDDSDNDNEPERSSMRSGGGLKGEEEARLAASQAPATAPRSSLVGDVKREMIQKQQIEHQRRREAALKQQQETRDAEWRQQRVELEQQRARMEALNVVEARREVEVAPREIEVVRRAPVKKPAPTASPMESYEF